MPIVVERSATTTITEFEGPTFGEGAFNVTEAIHAGATGVLPATDPNARITYIFPDKVASITIRYFLQDASPPGATGPDRQFFISNLYQECCPLGEVFCPSGAASICNIFVDCLTTRRATVLEELSITGDVCIQGSLSVRGKIFNPIVPRSRHHYLYDVPSSKITRFFSAHDMIGGTQHDDIKGANTPLPAKRLPIDNDETPLLIALAMPGNLDAEQKTLSACLHLLVPCTPNENPEECCIKVRTTCHKTMNHLMHQRRGQTLQNQLHCRLVQKDN